MRRIQYPAWSVLWLEVQTSSLESCCHMTSIISLAAVWNHSESCAVCGRLAGSFAHAATPASPIGPPWLTDLATKENTSPTWVTASTNVQSAICGTGRSPSPDARSAIRVVASSKAFLYSSASTLFTSVSRIVVWPHVMTDRVQRAR